MTLERADVTIDFDHHRPADKVDPDTVMAELRERCPVGWTEAHGGFWVVSGYADVERVIKDYRYFSSREGVAIPPPPYDEIGLLDYDPPEHTAYRRAMNPMLTREAVAEFEQRIAYWADLFIDRVVESGTCDLVRDIAVPIPAAVTLEWIGWEARHEWAKIGQAWHDIFGQPFGSPAHLDAVEVIGWADERIGEEVERRRAQPQDDPLTAIALMEIDGQQIPRQRAVNLVRLLISAGIDTTTSVIGSGLVHLHFHPEQRRRLREQPELLPDAVEEFVRRYTPARNPARTCVQEVEIGGCRFKPGDRVLPSLSSANQDEEVFEDADDVTLGRSGNRHLGFGAGVHRCLGMHLARVELCHVTGRVLERLGDYCVIEEGLVRYARQSEVYGWMIAPATFIPGDRVLPVGDEALAPVF